MTLKESKPSDFPPHFFQEGFPDFEEPYYFNARWYDPGTGRFITEDPIRDGLLWYAYVSNNPLKYIDPTGLMSDAAALAAAEEGRDIEDSDSKYGHTLPTKKEERQKRREAKKVIKENEKQYQEIYEDIVRIREDIFSFDPGQGDMDVLLEQLKNLINEYGDLKIATALDTMLRSNEIFFAPENFNGVQYIDYSLTGMLLLSGSVDYGYVAEFDQGRLIQASPYTALNGGFISNGGLDLTANFGRIGGVGFDDFFGWGSSISVSGSFMGIGFTGGSAIVGASGNNPQNIYEGESYGIETTTRKLVPNSVGYTAFPADVSLMSGYTWAAEKDVFGLGM